MSSGGRRATTDDAGQPLPFRQRVVKPVPYYPSETWPQDLIPTAQRVFDEWNESFQEGIRSIRRIECQEAGEADCSRYATETHQVSFAQGETLSQGDT